MSTFEEQLEQHGNLVFPNKGVSMMPLLRQDRDLMVIEKKGAERCKKYDAVLFKRGDSYVMHRILEVREDGYMIAGDNCAVLEFVRDDQILGVMTAVVRDGKTIPVTDPAYLRYVHLWCDHFPLRASLIKARQKLGGWKRKLL